MTIFVGSALRARIALTLVALLGVYLNRTRAGQAIQATAMDAEAARLVGIDVGKIYASTFAIGAALAGAAGALFAVIIGCRLIWAIR